jgi:hypothetical protein
MQIRYTKDLVTHISTFLLLLILIKTVYYFFDMMMMKNVERERDATIIYLLG